MAKRKLETVNDYVKYLNKLGYKEAYFDYLDCELIGIDLIDDADHRVWLGISMDEDYINEVLESESDEEIEWDYKRMYVTNALIECVYTNVAGFTDDSRNGITLVDDTQSDYYPHHLDLFEQCIWIQRHPIEHEYRILKDHVFNLKRIKDYAKILKKYDFYQDYSSIFDADKDSGYSKDSSNPLVTFKFNNGREIKTTFYFETDCITGNLLINSKIADIDFDFENYLVEDFMCDKHGRIDLEFEYLFHRDDPKWNKNTYNEVMVLIDGVIHNDAHTLKDVNFDMIPDIYADYIEKAKDIINNSTNF